MIYYKILKTFKYLYINIKKFICEVYWIHKVLKSYLKLYLKVQKLTNLWFSLIF